MSRSLIKVFVSSTTADLGSYRDLAEQTLLSQESFHPVVQRHFPPDYRTLKDFLIHSIAECDAVICLIGTVFGAMPTESGDLPRSYTQIEYDVARELGKPVYLFLSAPGFMPDQNVIESAECQTLQQRHRDAILTSGYKWEPLASLEQLRDRLKDLTPILLRECGRQPILFLHPPKPPSYFAGRADELAQLKRAASVDDPCVIAVVGLGGQGKTTLVYEWLRRLKGFAFARGFWCTAYRGGFTFEHFLDQLLAYLLEGRFDKRTMPETEQRIDCVVGEFQRLRTLVVIDGIERWLVGGSTEESEVSRSEIRHQRRGHFAGLDELLERVSGVANGSHLLITTRAMPAALDDAAVAMVPIRTGRLDDALDGLDDDAACEFLERLGIKDDRTVLREEARRYRNHPLSLTVLGNLAVREYNGHLKSLPANISALDPDERLAQLLEEMRIRLPGGERAEHFLQLAAHCFEDPSFELLARVLGAATAARADQPRFPAIAAESERALRKLMAELRAWQLIQWDSDETEERIHLHPVVKDFFSRTVTEPQSIHQTLAYWYRQFPPPEHPTALNELCHLSLSIEHSLAAGNIAQSAEAMFALVNDTQSFSEWLGAWGHLEHGIQLLSRLAAASDSSPMQNAAFLIDRAALLHRINRPVHALPDLEQAIAILDRPDDSGSAHDQRLLATALENRGNALRDLGRTQESVAVFDRAASLQEQCHEDHAVIELARILVNRGNACHDLGQWTIALDDYDRALQLFQRVFWLHAPVVVPLLAWSRVNREIVIGRLGRNSEAASELQSAIDAFVRLQVSSREDLIHPLAHARTMLGNQLRILKQLPEAVQQLDLAATALVGLRDRGFHDAELDLALVLVNRAQVHAARTDSDHALQDADEAVGIYQRLMGDGRPQLRGYFAHALLVRAENRQAVHDESGAAADLRTGVALFQTLMREWPEEADVRIVFLQRALEAVLSRRAAVTDDWLGLVSTLEATVIQFWRDFKSVEGIQITVRQTAESLIRSDALRVAGIEADRLTECLA